MQTIAIIPARGGSKRLPRKNILPVLEKPALFYPIQAAIKSQLFDRVIVSTEDDEIAQVAKSCGASVMGRSRELSGDRARAVDVCVDVLEKLGADGVEPDYFCCIYATAVFIRPKDLLDSFRILERTSDIDVVMGVSEYHLQPMQALESVNGRLKPRWPEYVTLQSQDSGRLVASNGTIYWAEVCAFLKQKSFYVEKMTGYEIPWIRAIDLDTPKDLEVAQMIAPLILGGEKNV